VHPEGAGILAFGTGGVEMELLENCGHMPILEQPKETAALYRSFLGRVAHAN
jgi:pimeloyl-ACP methyl ester carboxylesterase